MALKNKFLTKNIKLFLILTLIFLSIIGIYIYHSNFIFKRYYTSKDFGIDLLKSNTDFNNNGIDDYTDILNGAKIEVKNHPKYISNYYEGGYPPDDVGVCTDLVWRAFKNAGYCLKDMVDKDITLNLNSYINIKKPDKNIDFRRVKNLKIFFERNSAVLTSNPHEIEKWQPGDIVIYNDNHIAIISDKRNNQGLPYIIHHYSFWQLNLEEDALTNSKITGHYRFDANLVDKDFLIKWT